MILLESHSLGQNQQTAEFLSSTTFNNPIELVIDLNSLYQHPYRGFVYQVFNDNTNDEFTGNWERLYHGKQHYSLINLNKPFRLGFRVYRGANELKIYRL